MSKKANIHLSVNDLRTFELIREQILSRPDMTCDPDCPADLVFGTDQTLRVLHYPMRLGEVIDRLRYILSGRERFVEDTQSYDLGVFFLYADKNVLEHKDTGETVRLTDKERLLIRTLYDAPDHKESREALLDKVWGYASGTETHTLETHLYRLRQKLEPFGAQSLIQADGQGHYSLVI